MLLPGLPERFRNKNGGLLECSASSILPFQGIEMYENDIFESE